MNNIISKLNFKINSINNARKSLINKDRKKSVTDNKDIDIHDQDKKFVDNLIDEV